MCPVRSTLNSFFCAIFLPADTGSPGPGVQEDHRGGVRAGLPAAGPGADRAPAGPRLYRGSRQQILQGGDSKQRQQVGRATSTRKPSKENHVGSTKTDVYMWGVRVSPSLLGPKTPNDPTVILLLMLDKT